MAAPVSTESFKGPTLSTDLRAMSLALRWRMLRTGSFRVTVAVSLLGALVFYVVGALQLVQYSPYWLGVPLLVYGGIAVGMPYSLLLDQFRWGTDLSMDKLKPGWIDEAGIHLEPEDGSMLIPWSHIAMAYFTPYGVLLEGRWPWRYILVNPDRPGHCRSASVVDLAARAGVRLNVWGNREIGRWRAGARHAQALPASWPLSGRPGFGRARPGVLAWWKRVRRGT